MNIRTRPMMLLRKDVRTFRSSKRYSTPPKPQSLPATLGTTLSVSDLMHAQLASITTAEARRNIGMLASTLAGFIGSQLVRQALSKDAETKIHELRPHKRALVDFITEDILPGFGISVLQYQSTNESERDAFRLVALAKWLECTPTSEGLAVMLSSFGLSDPDFENYRRPLLVTIKSILEEITAFFGETKTVWDRPMSQGGVAVGIQEDFMRAYHSTVTQSIRDYFRQFPCVLDKDALINLFPVCRSAITAPFQTLRTYLSFVFKGPYAGPHNPALLMTTLACLPFFLLPWYLAIAGILGGFSTIAVFGHRRKSRYFANIQPVLEKFLQKIVDTPGNFLFVHGQIRRSKTDSFILTCTYTEDTPTGLKRHEVTRKWEDRTNALDAGKNIWGLLGKAGEHECVLAFHVQEGERRLFGVRIGNRDYFNPEIMAETLAETQQKFREKAKWHFP